MFLKKIISFFFSEKTNCMVTSNRTVINDSDSYVLCWQGKYKDDLESKFFAIMLDNNGFVRYGFKSTERSCSKLYPKSNKIRHKSEYFRPYFKKTKYFFICYIYFYFWFPQWEKVLSSPYNNKIVFFEI